MQSFHQNSAVALLLREFRGKEIVSLLNRGNRGDGIIHMGGRQLMSSLGLVWKEYYETGDLSGMKGDVLLVYGAGALSRGTNTLARTVHELSGAFSQIVILPASFDLTAPRVRAFAETWNRKYAIFCREMVSFDSLRAANVRPGTLLMAHDMAFHADLSEWAARPAKGRAGLFRCDNEAAYGALPRHFGVCQDASRGTEREPEKLLDFVASFQEIHTDRCHGAISAAMMGRRVFFYPNNYFKNRAIYENSLAGLSHVRFVRKTSFSFSQFRHALYWGRMRPIEMKVRRLFQPGRAKSPSRA